MFWFWKKDKQIRKDLEEAKDRIEFLEKKYEVLALTLQNLQSALVAISRSHDNVSHEVHSIQEMVAHFLHDLDPAMMMLCSTKDIDSMN